MFLKIIKKYFHYFTLFVFFSCFHAKASALSLQDYLCQVKKYNLGFEASQLLAKGAKLRAKEGHLLMEPTLFAEGQYLKNSSDPNWIATLGNNSLQSYQLQSYRAGISETTPYGIKGKLYYNFQHQTINGASPLLNQGQISTSSPVLEMDVPLSRNFAGRETRASALLISSTACQRHYTERFKVNLLLAEAEKSYWRLAITREIVSKRQQGIDRAIKIYAWVKQREKRYLAEDSDLLQATAGVEIKKLDLQAAMNDERLAAIQFNTLRGKCTSIVPEPLTSCQDEVEHFLLPIQPGWREDVLAAHQEEYFAIANAILGIEKNKPDLELYASYALNGNNPSVNEAVTQSFSFNYPTTAVGIRLSLPLDLCQLKRNRVAYHKEMMGAKYQFQQKLYENNRLWQELITKIQNAKERLVTVTTLEKIQLQKLQVERIRLSNGKTTTYQVLLFEQEYASTQVTTLAIKDEILELLAELKTFGAMP